MNIENLAVTDACPTASMNTPLKIADILTVHTVTRPNLRADEFFVFVGQVFLRELFDEPDKDMSHHTDVSLIYPERWCNILELRALYQAIEVRCPNIKKLYIKTHSAFILQCSPNGTVFVIDNPTEYPEIKYKLGVRYSPIDTYDGGLMTFSM